MPDILEGACAAFVDTSNANYEPFICPPKVGFFINGAVEADSTSNVAPAVPIFTPDTPWTGASFGVVDQNRSTNVQGYGNIPVDGFPDDINTFGRSFVSFSAVTFAPVSGLGGSSLNNNMLTISSGTNDSWFIGNSWFGATDPRAYYLALFGDSMDSVTGTFVLPDDGSDVVIDDSDGDWDLVIFFGTNLDDGFGTFTSSIMNVGAVDADGNMFSISYAAEVVSSSDSQQARGTDTAVLMAPTFVHGFGYPDTGHEATAVMTSGGFTVSQVNPPAGTDVTYGYIKIRDPNGGFAVGYDTMDNGASGLSFGPDAALLFSAWRDDDSYGSDGAYSQGLKCRTSSLPPDPVTEGASYSQMTVNNGSGGGMDTPAEMWSSSNGGYSLFQSNAGGSIIETLDVTLTGDGFTTSASDTSKKYGYICMKGSFQSNCVDDGPPDEEEPPLVFGALNLSKVRFRSFMEA